MREPPRQRWVVVGGTPLSGRLRVQGAKNAVLPLLAACLLAEEPCLLLNTPRLTDVAAMAGILRHLGASVRETNAEGLPALAVDARGLSGHEVPDALMRRLRSSIFVMGPLLGRLGRARISLPGGCDIGPRPVDFHLHGLQALGARIREVGGSIEAEASRLRGAEIYLDQPSVGATENVMLAATQAEGTTVIRNAAREPEVADLQAFLNAMGADVRGAGGSVITVRGPRRLGGARHEVIPDRIEAGTWLLAAAISGGAVELEGAVPGHLAALRAKLAEAGFPVEVDGDRLRLDARGGARWDAPRAELEPLPARAGAPSGGASADAARAGHGGDPRWPSMAAGAGEAAAANATEVADLPPPPPGPRRVLQGAPGMGTGRGAHLDAGADGAFTAPGGLPGAARAALVTAADRWAAAPAADARDLRQGGVRPGAERGRPRPTNIHTQPYPGFPTDLQNLFMALLLRARGTSIVTETIFDNRFRIVDGFLRMGAQISTYGRVAVVNGVPRLTGAEAEAGQDLRGAAALVLAGLSAEGTTVVHGAECLARGYEDFAGRLRALGAEVRVEEE